ncbi:PREDICTED: protein eva-1 homolog C isoform X2 [Trachymyrmex cornetzi]|uniref:protein eva-1 homolog C isoform X2 n=1 Tax=Trachymyrmex cornetzi TaxID=471704 RepID=UPI00084F027D|nr:PREDICTED: protein eva-1 homolog C isoform X2 [Trachymyrmex cornetzi]
MMLATSDATGKVMILLAVWMLLLRAHRVAGADHLALLSGTLKTYQRAACDEETMTLKCPPGTTILVEHAQYGRTGMHGISKCNSSVPLMITGDKPTNHTCIWPQSVQHSLLQMVVGVCQKKRQCKFNTDPKTFQGDPCPGLRKYIEVAYKCRPYEFRSKVACENEVVNLVCHPGQRVAIFSAAFGRTQYESLQCPQPLGVQEETCMMDFTTETVMQLCHGKRRCTVVANSTTFGRPDPCSPDSKTYLKVVYTCVPRSVLREQFEGGIEPDEAVMQEFEEGFDRADFRAEFSPSPNLEGPQPPPRDNVSKNFPTVSSSPPRARTNNDDNQEKFYLYIIVSVSAGILLFLGLVIGRLLISRHRAKRDAKFHANNEALPNGFTDDISEIDADIDLTTPVAVPMQDARLPETQLAERLHGERYYADTRIPLSPTSIHATSVSHATNTGMRVDLGNHMVGTDNLHTILRTENPRNLNSKSYYYG